MQASTTKGLLCFIVLADTQIQGAAQNQGDHLVGS